MKLISLVAAIDEANGLGINNELLCYQPADLQHFKTITLGKPIIMGRNTFKSIGKPLPGRLNIVLSRTSGPIEGVMVVNNLDQVFSHTHDDPEIMIIGGAQLYKQTIGLATHMYITRIHHKFEADVFFPKIDESIWRCTNEEFRKHDDKNKFDMTYMTFEKH